ncbi:MAG TPA: GNAT family N-acetyltransferase [Mycobacterium sp.]|nr:GNAT family N-acetyltransferase [Mycobacterium sp.]
MNPPALDQRRARLTHPEFAAEFVLRHLDLDRDLAAVHSWMNDPEVARFWRKAWSRDRIAAYLRQQDRSTHSVSYIGELDGTPMSYWELYRADLDPLADHYPARDHDAGIHLLLGPTRSRGRGLATILLHTVTAWQLDADPDAARVVGEPDVTNERVIRIAEQAGFRRVMDIDLPDKRAALMVFDRDRDQHRGPGHEPPARPSGTPITG